MKKIFIAFLLASFSILPFTEAAPKTASSPISSIFSKKSETSFEAQIVASTQDPKMEWWFNLPANSAPNVVGISRILYFQNFSIFSFFDNAEIKDGKFDITYTITSKDPQGKRTVAAENVELKGSAESKGVIIASTYAVQASFDKNSPEGLYTFEISAKDNISGKTSKSSINIRLAEWIAPIPMSGEEKVNNAIFNFYKNPSPEDFYSIFYSRDLNLEQRGAPNDLNYIYLGFVRAAFLRNSFLSSYLREAFPTMTPLDRAKTIYLFAITGEARIDFDILTENERKYQDAMRKADIPAPYADWDVVLGAVQIDMLWGEFFADGTYKPIRRIMDLLSYTEEGNFTITSISQKKKPTNQQEWKKMMMGAYHNVAIRSLLKNTERFELLRKYCVWALQNKDIPEPTRKFFEDIAEKK